MQVEVITPDKTAFDGEAESVKLPGTDGSFEVLKDHAPLISSLGKGLLRVLAKDGKESSFTIDGGIVEVLNNRVVVLAETII